MVGKTKAKDIDYIKEEFEKEGYILLTDSYNNQQQKLEYICPNGHRRNTTWKNWKRGRRCLICKNNSTKPSIEQVKISFENEGYVLISKEYVTNKTKLDYICPEGHKNSITWADWNSGGYRCPDCANNKKLSIDKITSDFESEGYTFISGNYQNNTSTLVIKCSVGHEFETTRVKWTSGNRCPECYRNRVNIDLIKESFAICGYTLLSDKYIDSYTKLDYICPNGHKHNISWAAWKQGERCFHCRNDNNRISIEEIKNILHKSGCVFVEGSYTIGGSFSYLCQVGHLCKASNIGSINYGGTKCAQCYGNAKLKYCFVKDNIEAEDYTVVTEEEDYFNNRTKLHLICPNKHDYHASWFDWNTNKVRCYKCKEKGTSLQEQEIIGHIKSWGVDIEVHDRYLINPYELDVLIYGKKVAIEYCGLYWHSDLMGKGRNYHVNKLNMCNDAGYRLITVFEDELLYKRDIVLNRLRHILNINDSKKIYARQCKIREVDTSEVASFCKQNHLQGYTGSSIKLGAFKGDDLLAVMTFAKPSISKGNKLSNKYVWELSRFCTVQDCRVVGIASKLLKYFVRNYVWESIFSYADRRWSDGNLYKQIGFEFIGSTKSNYWYFKNGDINRIHRFALRKKPDEPKDVTEWELRKAQGWNRVWDCGSLKYVMYNN